MKLAGKVALITGATAGIGFAIAERFLKEGAKVAICGRTQSRVDEAVKKLREFGEIEGYVADVGQKSDVQKMVESFAKKNNDRIDILVNNAGITMDSQFHKMTDEQFEQVMQTNLFSVFYCTKAVVPYMIKNNYGKIISTSSASGFNGNFGQSNYAASKAAITGMSKVLAKELGKYNINVNSISPGFVSTDMTAAMPPEVQERLISLIPLKRTGQPNDLANVYAFVASDEASFISGVNIVVDGGRNCFF